MPKFVRFIDKSRASGRLFRIYSNIHFFRSVLLLPLITTQLNCEAISDKTFLLPYNFTSEYLYTFTMEHVLPSKHFISVRFWAFFNFLELLKTHVHVACGCVLYILHSTHVCRMCRYMPKSKRNETKNRKLSRVFFCNDV